MTVERSYWDTWGPWRRILWEQTRLAWLSRELHLLHGLAYACPLAAACPTVVTVHDLSFIRYPEAFRPFNRIYLNCDHLGLRPPGRARDRCFGEHAP